MLLLRPNAHAVDAPDVDAHVVEAPAVDAHVVEAPAVEAEEAGEVTARGLLIAEARIGCNVGQAKTAQKMLSMNTKTIESFSVGDLVLVRVPDVDRGPFDPNNLLCFILEIKEQMFRLGSRAGVLNTLFACNSIEATRWQSNLTSEDIPIALDKKGVETGVQEAVAALSVGHGQGYFHGQRSGSCATLR